MLALNLIFWTFLSSGFYIFRNNLDPQTNDFLTSNDFVPSHYDSAFAMLLGGFVIIWLWHKLSLLFLNTWETLSMSPIQLWMLKNLGVWGYGLVGLFIMPQLIWLIAVPGLFLIEKIGFHIGDYIMPAIVATTSVIFNFLS